MRIVVSPAKQFAITRLGALSLQATAPRPIRDEEWDLYLDALADDFAEFGDALAVFQYSPKVGPSAAQRQRLTSRLKTEMSKTTHVAHVTESMIVRGVVTAINWIVRSSIATRAFSPSEVREALQYLKQATDFSVDEAMRMLDCVV